MALYLQKYRSLCILCLFSLIVLLAIYIFLRQSGDLEQSLYLLFGSIVLLFLIVLSESRRPRNSARHFGSFISATNEEGSIMLMYDDAAISTDKLH